MSRIKVKYYQIYYKLLKKYWEKKSRKSKVNGKCLMYHHITDKHVDINDSCQCKIDVFKNILKKYRDDGWNFVSLDRAIELIESKSKSKFIIITFDDVPSNVYENAYPILKELNIPFSLFITIDFIGREGYLSLKQIEIFNNDSLCTIGSHTITHPILRKSKDYEEEIVLSKKKLEVLLNKPVNYFAYPYGGPSAVAYKHIKCVKNAGYRCAFSTVSSKLSDYTSSKCWFLPRIVENS